MESRVSPRSRGPRLHSRAAAGWAAVGIFGLFALAAVFLAPSVEAAAPAVPGATYVGSETCKGCHEDQFKKLDATLHSRVLGRAGPDRVQQQACESCHGPGSKHLEDQANPQYSVRFGQKSGHPWRTRMPSACSVTREASACFGRERP